MFYRVLFLPGIKVIQKIVLTMSAANPKAPSNMLQHQQVEGGFFLAKIMEKLTW